MAHLLPPLPFAEDALEPHISAETVRFHYGRHHRAYVEKTNLLSKGTLFESLSLEETVLRADGPLFDQAAQAWNHTFYWNSLTPEPTAPSGPLRSAIQRDFEDLDGLIRQFTAAALGVFGSGWAWLGVDAYGGISIMTTSNANNLLGTDKWPLLCCDVWEHAYYVDYRNERNRYLGVFQKIMNWDFASVNYRSWELDQLRKAV
jgi:superoxide dismutase, Fe-Mn family